MDTLTLQFPSHRLLLPRASLQACLRQGTEFLGAGPATSPGLISETPAAAQSQAHRGKNKHWMGGQTHLTTSVREPHTPARGMHTCAPRPRPLTCCPGPGRTCLSVCTCCSQEWAPSSTGSRFPGGAESPSPSLFRPCPPPGGRIESHCCFQTSTDSHAHSVGLRVLWPLRPA